MPIVPPHILDHARLCGSLDIYLVADAHQWFLVEGVELSEDAARVLAIRPEGIMVVMFHDEAEAVRAFELRKEKG